MYDVHYDKNYVKDIIICIHVTFPYNCKNLRIRKLVFIY